MSEVMCVCELTALKILVLLVLTVDCIKFKGEQTTFYPKNPPLSLNGLQPVNQSGELPKYSNYKKLNIFYRTYGDNFSINP